MFHYAKKGWGAIPQILDACYVQLLLQSIATLAFYLIPQPKINSIRSADFYVLTIWASVNLIWDAT